MVDNNSHDRTREVVEEFCHRCPGHFGYAFEPQPGKSHVLKTGIREAKGDILALIDDDVAVESTWHGRRWGTHPSSVENYPPPPWIPLKERYGLAPLAMFDLGLEPGPLAEPPFGTNMTFQERMFEKYASF